MSRYKTMGKKCLNSSHICIIWKESIWGHTYWLLGLWRHHYVHSATSKTIKDQILLLMMIDTVAGWPEIGQLNQYSEARDKILGLSLSTSESCLWWWFWIPWVQLLRAPQQLWIDVQLTTIKNMQANPLIKWLHQSLGDKHCSMSFLLLHQLLQLWT